MVYVILYSCRRRRSSRIGRWTTPRIPAGYGFREHWAPSTVRSIRCWCSSENPSRAAADNLAWIDTWRKRERRKKKRNEWKLKLKV